MEETSADMGRTTNPAEDTSQFVTLATSSLADGYQQKRKFPDDADEREDASDTKKGKNSSFEGNTSEVLPSGFNYDRMSEASAPKSHLDIFDESNMPPLFNHLNHIQNISTVDVNVDSAVGMSAEMIMNISDTLKSFDGEFAKVEPERQASPVPPVLSIPPSSTVPSPVQAPPTAPAASEEPPIAPADPPNTNDNKLDEAENKSEDQSEEKKKVSNVRKNIRDVFDDQQLDTNTLTAQRLEVERLNRVQEQQRNIRETQRQNRVLSLLQGNHSLLLKPNIEVRSSSSNGPDAGNVIEIDSSDCDRSGLPSGTKTDEAAVMILDDSADEEKEQPTKDVVTIIDSSDDDCILLSDVDDDDDDEEDGADAHNSGLHVNDKYNTPDEFGRVIINVGHPETETDIYLAPQIARNIKPHQIGGVRFLYDNIIESLERFNSSEGFGCILAHSMGLGKTLQLCCFCDIFLRHTNSKSVLCIMPINTLQNWVAEFNMWLPPEEVINSPLHSTGEVRPRNFKVYVLNDTHKSLQARCKLILEWAATGGVLLMGYELFRLLSMKKLKRRKVMRNVKREERKLEEEKNLLDQIYAALVSPGPDLVVCDEGHRIKNSHASISVALKQIRSKRRIVLTGYPLQNNLVEYWCMVDFVRPNYLGTRTEFCNMFERPIQNGQCVDSTPQDMKLMRYRAHVLHSLLLGFVQRRSHIVLQATLPQKNEYVLLIRLTEFQRKLYDVFMNDVVRTKAVPNPLKAFAVCCKIWNHPDVLFNYLKKREFDLDLEETYNNISIDEVKSIAADLKIDSTGSDASQLISNSNSLTTNEGPSCSDQSTMNSTEVACANGSNGYSAPKIENEFNDKQYSSASISNGMAMSDDSLQMDTAAMQPEKIDNEQKTPNAASTNAIVPMTNSDVKDVKTARDDSIPYDWAVDAMKDYAACVLENSPKMEIFICILEECIRIGDRLLVFSQSLLTLNLIEQFLRIRPARASASEQIFWRKNENYFRKCYSFIACCDTDLLRLY